VNVKALYFLLIGLLALAVVMIIQVVGLILVIALLTIPPFIAEKYSKSLFQMMVLSVVLSAFFSFTGLWFSYVLNLTSGAAIIMVAGLVFFISLVIERWMPTISHRGSKPVGK
jgi:zinc transport system permease protein